jgi:predicted O-linked N-acetylglucosamine transferase (SPINDLY family)
VTWSIDEYIECAVRLAQDPVTLARLRETLRPAMASSAFCDADRFVATLEAAFRGMWRTWCKSQATLR